MCLGTILHGWLRFIKVNVAAKALLVLFAEQRNCGMGPEGMLVACLNGTGHGISSVELLQWALYSHVVASVTFHKGFMRSWSAFNGNLFCSGFISNDLTAPQICIGRDSWVVVTCASLRPDLVITFYVRVTQMFTRYAYEVIKYQWNGPLAGIVSNVTAGTTSTLNNLRCYLQSTTSKLG